MSSRSPLLLLSGAPGVAGSIASHLAADGQRVRLIAVGEPDPEVVSLIRETVGPFFGAVGADPIASSAWSRLAPVTQLSALWRARTALADPEVDFVVLDAGSCDRAQELIDLPSVLSRLLDSLLTARLAMWRRPQDSAGSAFDALSRLRGEVNRLIAMLEHPRTTARLIAEPAAVGDTVRLMPVFALLGVGVEGVAARAGSGAGPAGGPADADADLDWFVGPWSTPVRLTADSLAVIGDAETGYELVVPLIGDARREATVGRCGTDLVVEYRGQQRWLPLPAALARCSAESAVRTAPGLRVRFVPDPALWRPSSPVPA